MDKFIFESDVPALIAKQLKKELKPYAWLVPGWCQRVYVSWASPGSSDGILITSNTLYEYRSVKLTFFPQFFDQAEGRQEHILHDLLHAFAAPLVDYAYDTIDRLVPPEEAPKFRDSLLEELRVRNESFVQDLAHCLAAKLV